MDGIFILSETTGWNMLVESHPKLFHVDSQLFFAQRTTVLHKRAAQMRRTMLFPRTAAANVRPPQSSLVASFSQVAPAGTKHEDKDNLLNGTR